MKRILWIAIFALAGMAGAQESPPMTTVPSDRNYKKHPDWVQWMEMRVENQKNKPCEMVFVGDSITAQWVEVAGQEVWRKNYGERALNLGVGGDKTQHVLWRLENMDLKSFKPKVAVVMIGTNNIADSVADIAAGVKAVLDATRRTFPEAKIILVSILPRDKPVLADKTAAVNKIIRTYADDSSVFYFDLAAQFTPEGDSWKGLCPDRLHLSTEGYEMWASAMKPLLERLIAGQSR
jgi:lysophospholipase L1-like esterase